MEKNYKFELEKQLPIGVDKIDHYGSLVKKLVDECNDVNANYILIDQKISPILYFSSLTKNSIVNGVFGPCVWGTLTTNNGDITVVATPNLDLGEIALCIGNGVENLPLTSFDDYENRGKSIQEQFDKETIAYGIIK